MNGTLALSVVLLLTTPAEEIKAPQRHPFVDDEMAVFFGTEALSQGYIHHEFEKCLTSSVKFSIEIELPLPKARPDRKFSVTSPDCAKQRKEIIEKLLVRFPASAFKKVKSKTVFNFDLTQRYRSE
jgi:hypothetical protein